MAYVEMETGANEPNSALRAAYWGTFQEIEARQTKPILP
jgi:hypothetical protein